MEESTHRHLRSAGVAAVEAESHHVGLLVQVTRAVVVVELQVGVVDVPVLQQTGSQVQSGRVLGADCGVA